MMAFLRAILDAVLLVLGATFILGAIVGYLASGRRRGRGGYTCSGDEDSTPRAVSRSGVV